jgi:hypothetical protein
MELDAAAAQVAREEAVMTDRVALTRAPRAGWPSSWHRGGSDRR